MVTKNKIVWSLYQEAIFEDMRSGKGHTVVVARAGSSKTTTLIESINHIPNKKAKVLCIAFNTSIVKELKERIDKSYITVSTLHSLGYSAVRGKFPKIKLDMAKSIKIIKHLLPEHKYLWAEIYAVDKTVSLCKNFLIDTPSKIDDLMDQFDIIPFFLEREDFIRMVIKTLRICKDDVKSLDFNDMIYFPNVYSLPIPKYDIVLIDEQQDISLSQMSIALSSCKPGGRIIAYGDDRQAIYQWRGAAVDAIFHMKKILNAKTLVLPISYRCPIEVIKLASKIVPDIQPAPFAKMGKIEYIKESQLINYAQPGSFVISRTNAPLIKLAMRFVKFKIPCNIKGKDISIGLKYLIKISTKKKLDTFIEWLYNWKISEVSRLQAKNKDTSYVLDKYDCIMNLCEDAKTLEALTNNINKLFNEKDDKNIVNFMTTHGAKGLENDNVFLLNYTYSTKDYESSNIFYVALTRSKNRLIFVSKN